MVQTLAGWFVFCDLAGSVAYLALADNVLGPLPSHLCRLTQPIIRPPNRFSTPHLTRLTSISAH
jgi:hypothetical protein